MEGDRGPREDARQRAARVARRSRVVLAAAAGLLGLAAAPVLARAVRSWPARAAVVDRSMEPALLPGDWVLVDPDVGRVRAGNVVVAVHPEHDGESIVKRLRAFDGDRALLTADAPRGRDYEVEMRSLTGRAWFRYWPASRLGRVR